MAKLNEIMLWKVISICYKCFWQAFLTFFLACLAFAVRASDYDTNRFSIVYINDYFHLKIRHVIMILPGSLVISQKGLLSSGEAVYN